MPKSLLSWVRSQHPPTQWNLRVGRSSSVEQSTQVLKTRLRKRDNLVTEEGDGGGGERGACSSINIQSSLGESFWQPTESEGRQTKQCWIRYWKIEMCILSLSRVGFSKACYPFSLFLKINTLDTKIQIQIVGKNIVEMPVGRLKQWLWRCT